MLLAAVVASVPAWIEQGPRGIVNAFFGYQAGTVAGAIESIAVNPNNSSQVYVATVNGGVWVTNNASITNPGAMSWVPLTDQQASLATSSVAFSPLDPTGKTLYVGTGGFSALGAHAKTVGI